ncbi:MAG TPA: DsbA family protein [Holophaga sp.]|nr:DsbA family protein [Holophaga sp.]
MTICRLILTLALMVPVVQADPPVPPVVGSFSGGTVTEKDVETRGRATLFMLRQEQYELKARIIEDLAFEKLLMQEARRRNMTPETLIRDEVEAGLPEPTPEALQKARRELRQSRQLPSDESSALAEVRQVLRQRDLEARFRAFRARLLEAGDFRVDLEPPRAILPERPHSPSRGPKDAPLTLVEFSDFTCPYSRAAQEVLRRVWELYPGQVRHIWRALPVEDKVPAQAALWSQARARYWSFGAQLFAAPTALTVDVLKAQAASHGLGAEELGKALAQGAQVQAVDQDLADAAELGLDSSPSFVVNGRILRGMPPLAELARLLNEELRRVGQLPTPEQAAAAAF